MPINNERMFPLDCSSKQRRKKEHHSISVKTASQTYIRFTRILLMWSQKTKIVVKTRIIYPNKMKLDSRLKEQDYGRPWKTKNQSKSTPKFRVALKSLPREQTHNHYTREYSITCRNQPDVWLGSSLQADKPGDWRVNLVPRLKCYRPRRWLPQIIVQPWLFFFPEIRLEITSLSPHHRTMEEAWRKRSIHMI